MQKKHPGSRWVTLHGHHVLINKDGHVVALGKQDISHTPIRGAKQLTQDEFAKAKEKRLEKTTSSALKSKMGEVYDDFLKERSNVSRKTTASVTA